MNLQKIILKIIIFLIPIATIIGYLEFKLSKIPNSYTQKRHLLESQLDSIEVLTLGPSHMFFGTDPKCFSKYGFNLAYKAQPLYYDIHITEKYLDKLPRLRMVIVDIGYMSLYYQMGGNNGDAWRRFFYSQFWDVYGPNMSVIDTRRYSKLALYTPVTCLDYIKKNFKVDISEKMERNGFVPVNDSFNQSLGHPEAVKKFQEWKAMMDSTQFKPICAELEEFIKRLKEKNIQIVFVTTPVLSEFTGLCDSNILNSNKNQIQNWCVAYNCQYFNYFTDDRFTKHDFYNFDHLNVHGAQKFSKIIDSEIIRTILK
jgi:hypothetical protein